VTRKHSVALALAKNESWSTSTAMFHARHRYKLSSSFGRGNSRCGYTRIEAA